MKLNTLEKIEEDRIAQSAKCWWCGCLFEKGAIWNDSNRYGIEVAGFQEKQIIFFHCHKCGNNTSLNRCIIQQTGRYRDYFESTKN
ncbi:MAG: hypothetical protein ACTSPV_17625 [Candidatus Hodarchaeales archaeon]